MKLRYVFAAAVAALLTLTGCQQQANAQMPSHSAYTESCHAQAQWLARVAEYQRAQEGAYAATENLFDNFVQKVRPAGSPLVAFAYERLSRGVRITVYCPEQYSVTAP